MSELTVILKDSERTYRHKFLLYSIYCVDPKDEVVIDCIRIAKESFQGDPESVSIRINLEIQ